jgi:hypothetical protein
MAFTKDTTTNDGYSLPVDGIVKHFVLKKRVSFASYPLAQNETVGLFKIPAGVLVLEVAMNVVTAQADISDLDVGDFTTAGVVGTLDGFLDGADPSSIGYKRDMDEAFLRPTGKIASTD